jgi:L-ascorbate metabolism protein UlaG (beta-lactamase superfamily)
MAWNERLTGLRELPANLRGGPGYRGARSDHFDGREFFNPGASAGKGWRDVLRWMRTRTPTPWPEWLTPQTDPTLPTSVDASEVAVTFINHMTCLIQFAQLNLLTDPVYSTRASPVQWAGPRRVHAPGVAFEQLPRIDIVFVSHNHFDHMDMPTLKRLARVQSPSPLFVTGLGNAAFFRAQGIENVVELDWWGRAVLPQAELMFTPALHWSSRGLGGRNRTLWGGLWIQVGDRTLYFSGDTAYSPLFSQLRQARGSPDLALLPIGAYEPRWFMCDQHMNPEEAVRAHRELGARTSMGTHFGCFQLTDEGIDEPVRALEQARREQGVDAVQFHAPLPGQTLLYRVGSGRLDIVT